MSSPKRSTTLNPNDLGRLESWLKEALGAESVRIDEARLLAGGAVQENWRLGVNVTGGARAGRHDWVLRTDPLARLPMSLDRAREYACIRAAYDAGVAVAEPIAVCGDAAVIGAPFAVQGLLSGVAQGRQIVRNPALSTFGVDLAREIGRQMALLHKVRPPAAGLGFLSMPEAGPMAAEVAQMRAALDRASEPRPALEFALSWLGDHAPEPRAITLVHGDLRTGNYMVDEGRLTGILDWEFAHWGDPREDLGWFCARCWRFGNDALAAGGIATRADLLAGYNAHATEPVNERELAVFEVLAAVRWGVIALLQGERFLTGGERSLELALTGLMPAEMELDALDGIAVIERGESLP